MTRKRKCPRIPGLAGFQESKAGPGIAYVSADTAVVAIGINEAEYNAYAAGFPQMLDTTTVPVHFGAITGFKTFGRSNGAVGYILTHDGYYTLLNVDPVNGHGPDVASVESALHSLTF